MTNTNMTKKCKDFCEKDYVEKYMKSKLTNKKKMNNATKNQINKSKKIISLMCKLNYCNKGCAGLGKTKNYPNNFCNTKKCKKTYKKIKKYPIDTFCYDDDMWNN